MSGCLKTFEASRRDWRKPVDAREHYFRILGSLGDIKTVRVWFYATGSENFATAFRDEPTRAFAYAHTHARPSSKGGPFSWRLVFKRDTRERKSEATARVDRHRRTLRVEALRSEEEIKAAPLIGRAKRERSKKRKQSKMDAVGERRRRGEKQK